MKCGGTTDAKEADDSIQAIIDEVWLNVSLICQRKFGKNVQ